MAKLYVSRDPLYGLEVTVWDSWSEEPLNVAELSDREIAEVICYLTEGRDAVTVLRLATEGLAGATDH